MAYKAYMAYVGYGRDGNVYGYMVAVQGSLGQHG